MNRLTALVLAVVAVGLWVWPAQDRFAKPAFRSDLPAVATDAPPWRIEGFVSPEITGRMAHVASICELSDDRLAAAWYSGSREGAMDVAIFFSTRGPAAEAAWSEPRPIVDRLSASRELRRYVKKVGNPLLFTDDDGRLWLVYVTITFGGWSASSLNVKTSDDGGATWTDSRRLTLSPFLNLSELVRNNPVPLQGGGFAIPIYHEFVGKFPELLWFPPAESPAGLSWRKTRMAGGRSYIQPSVVPLDGRSAQAFFRDGSDRRAVARALTRSGGVSWTRPAPLDLPNPDAAVSALKLSDGRLLMAFNDSRDGRGNLKLAVSGDQGLSWRRVATLEDQPGERFAYPYLFRARDGKIHLVYTWRMKRIKHVAFNESWLRAKEAAP